jgi:thioredoxin-dependent peroxiredoxin
VGADPSFSVINAYDAAFNIPVVGAVFANRISYVISGISLSSLTQAQATGRRQLSLVL